VAVVRACRAALLKRLFADSACAAFAFAFAPLASSDVLRSTRPVELPSAVHRSCFPVLRMFICASCALAARLVVSSRVSAQFGASHRAIRCNASAVLHGPSERSSASSELSMLARFHSQIPRALRKLLLPCERQPPFRGHRLEPFPVRLNFALAADQFRDFRPTAVKHPCARRRGEPSQMVCPTRLESRLRQGVAVHIGQTPLVAMRVSGAAST